MTPRNLSELGLQLAEKSHHIYAIKAFKIQLLHNPKDALAWYHIGLSYKFLDQIVEAILAFDQAYEFANKDQALMTKFYEESLALREKIGVFIEQLDDVRE